MNRRWSGLIAVTLALTGLVACSDDPEPEAAPQPSFTPVESPGETAEGEPGSLFYLLGRELLRFKTEKSVSLILGRVPSDQVAVGPDGKQVVFVQESSAKGTADGEFREPIIRIARAQRGLASRAVTLGPGQMPVWNQGDGRSVAAFDLEGDKVVYDSDSPPGQEGKPVPKDALWAEIEWDPEKAVAAVVGNVPVSDAALSPDGQTIAAVSDGALVMIDVESGEVTKVPDTDRARDVVWGPDGTSFAYVREGKAKAHDVYLCRSTSDCTLVFYWKRPVGLVALTT